MDLEEKAMFIFTFSLNKRSSNSRSWLKEMNTIFMTFKDLRNAFMFMGPDN